MGFCPVLIGLILLIPSYFGPILYTKGGYLDPPTISLTLSCTNVKFCKVLEIPFKVSENKKSVKKPFLWLPWQLFDNMVLFTNNFQNVYEKQVIFKRFQKHKFEGVKKTKLRVMIALFSYVSKGNFKMGGSASVWQGQVENRAKCGEIVILTGLKQGLSRLFPTHQNTLFYTFSDQIHPPHILKSTKKV